jgi:hypothetical protein
MFDLLAFVALIGEAQVNYVLKNCCFDLVIRVYRWNFDISRNSCNV